MRRLLVLAVLLVVVFAGSTTAPHSADAVVPGAVGKIVFWSDRDTAQGELYTRDFAGGAWHRLTWNAAYERESAFSPDGSSIAYSSDISGPSAIWVMNANGGAKHNITPDAFHNTEPTWSPDGSRIAYTSDHTASLAWDIWVMNADGSGKTNLTPSTQGSQDSYPAWSPDGSKIAFTSNRAGSPDVYVMNADGSNVTNLTNNTTWWDHDPTWSPDGAQIAYMSRPSGFYAELYVMNADGSNQHALTDISAPILTPTSKLAPAWSPDGEHISFTGFTGGFADLWMIDPDGSDLQKLTEDPGGEWWGEWESVNRLPSAFDDGPFGVRPGSTLAGSTVLANDTDPDGETLIATLEAPPSHASNFGLSTDGTFTYVHDGSATNSDSFTYRAKDTRSGISNIARATITIGAIDSVGLVDPSTGLWYLQVFSMGSSFYYGNPGDVPFVGDWNCDGFDTPGLYRQSDGFAYLRDSNTQGSADLTFFFGNPSDVPLAGDFNGDGCDTLSIYRPSEARFYIINQLGQNGGGLGAAEYSFLFGDAGDKPVVGDWDGDGIDEIGLHRESSGFFYYRNTLSTGVADGQFFFGDPGDRFVAGDWGVIDGRDTPGLFRPSNRMFYFRHTLTQGNADSQFTWTGSATGWLPVAGDFGP